MSVQKEQIPSLVADGINGLQQLLLILRDGSASSGEAAVESSLARFKLWAGSLGAHRASGSRSLQYRLRDASSIRTLLVSLLEDLSRLVLNEALPLVRNGRIQQAGKEDDEDSETEELTAYFGDDDGSESEEALDDHDKELNQVLSQIGGVIDCLLRLSVTISNPAPHDRFKSRAGGQVGYYEPWDIQHVLEKFPHLDAEFAERLGRALTQRRKYFKYREDHHCRLQQGLEGDDDGASKGRATTLASSVPLHLKDKGDTTLKLELVDLDDDRSELSATSYAPSTVDQSQLRVPPIPKEHTEGPFLCPFCYIFITVDNRREWKKHVFRDLRPYVCLSSACVAADQDFQRRKDWSRHMSQEHWRQWACPFGCAVNSHSPSSLRRHLEDVHATVTPAKSIGFLVLQSSKPDPKQSHGPCPLCNDVEIKSSHQYQSHVGNHLEQLALFVLPSHNYESEGEDGGDGDESDRDVEEDDELSSQDDYPLPDGKTAYWSLAEMNEFPNLLRRYGPDWLAISRHMKTKTRIMVKSFFNRMVIENPQWQQIADEASVEPRLEGFNHMVENTKYSHNVPNASEKPGESGHVPPTCSPNWAPNLFEIGKIIDIDETQERDDYIYGDDLIDEGTSGSDQQLPSPGTTELHGGELDRTRKDGKATSLASEEEVDMNEDVEGDVPMKRTHSEELADEEEMKRSLERRKKNASPEDLMPKKCGEPGCNKEFERAWELTRHKRTHSRPCKCPIESCKFHEYGFPNKKEMDRHCSVHHSIDPPMAYKCLYPACPWKSNRIDNCKRHMKQAHGRDYVRTETREMNNQMFSKSTTAEDHEKSGDISEEPSSERPDHRDDVSPRDREGDTFSKAEVAEPQATPKKGANYAQLLI